MAGGPPLAEEVEEDQEDEGHAEADRMSTEAVETESPVVEEEASDDGLEQIVGKAHLSDGGKAADCLPGVGPVVQKDKSGDIERHH